MKTHHLLTPGQSAELGVSNCSWNINMYVMCFPDDKEMREVETEVHNYNNVRMNTLPQYILIRH